MCEDIRTGRTPLKPRYRFFSAATLVALFLTLVVDRLTKIWVVGNLAFEQPFAPIPALDGWLNLTYIHNTGAAFGMFPQLGLFFATVAVIVVIGLVVYYDRLPVQHFMVRVAVGLIAGGALGNLVDRFVTGYVVDFVHIRLFAIINTADSAVSVGVAILGFYMMFMEEQHRAPAAEAKPVSDGGHDGC
ncbi:MAG: signal peptidase II [Anaerolineae bacterium]